MEHVKCPVYVFGNTNKSPPQQVFPVVTIDALTSDGRTRSFTVMVADTIVSTRIPLIAEDVRQKFDIPLSELSNGPEDIDVLFGSGEMWSIIESVTPRQSGYSIIDSAFGVLAAAETGGAKNRLALLAMPSAIQLKDFTSGEVSEKTIIDDKRVSVIRQPAIELKDFWILDHLGVANSELIQGAQKSTLTVEEFRKSTTRDPSGRYSTIINLNLDKIDRLSKNESQAKQQAKTLIKRLLANPEMKEQYSTEMNFFIDQGFAQRGASSRLRG